SNVQVFLRSTFNVPSMPRSKVGANNTFTLKNVAPMHYIVSVGGYPDTCFVKSIRYGGQEVTAAGGGINSRGTMAVVLSATAGSIDAAVVDGDSKPVPNATVALIAPDGTANRSSSSDENGTVSFRGLKPGDYKLMAFEDLEPGAWQDPDVRKP